MAAKILKFIFEYFKVNLETAMEYRVNFISQTIFMFLNDVVWLIFWIIFFNKFNAVNGWQFNDLIAMYVVITLSWGIMGVFFGNFREIADIIKNGQLDFYLALPKEELTHVLISKSKFDAFGDILFGLLLAVLFVPIFKFPLLILLVFISLTILLSFSIILGSLSFFIGSSTEIAESGLIGILSLGSYPFSIFRGYTKFILLTLIPAGFITGIPVEILKNFSWYWLGLSFLFALSFLIISIIIFKVGLRKYESGNLISVRV